MFLHMIIFFHHRLLWFVLSSVFVQADVIVNTTTTYMDFKSCPVSSSILAKAGQALQDDCRTKNPEGLKVGHITCTKGYGLRCKVVYHLTLPCWSSANSKQVGLSLYLYLWRIDGKEPWHHSLVRRGRRTHALGGSGGGVGDELRGVGVGGGKPPQYSPYVTLAVSVQNLSKVVTKCLTMASNKGYTSLVFPALGTGKLVYPRDVSARIMLEAIDEFQRDNPLTSVRDVRIVIYQKDRQTFQVRQR